MPIPKVYAKMGQNAIASYDYTDIAEGTGVIDFLGFTTVISGATLRHLGTKTVYSANIEPIFATATTYNFDLTTFNYPKIAKGTAYIGFSRYWAGTINHKLNIYFTIQKVSEGIATNIGSVQTAEFTSDGNPSIAHYLLNASLTTTHFKRGDILRLTIYAVHPSGTLYIGTDPANRDGSLVTPAATYPTKLEVYIPFKIDL